MKPTAVILTVCSLITCFCGLAFGLVALGPSAWLGLHIPQVNLIAQAGLAFLIYGCLVYFGVVNGVRSMACAHGDRTLSSGFFALLVCGDGVLLIAGMLTTFFLITRTEGPIVEILIGMALVGFVSSLIGCIARRLYDRSERRLIPCELPVFDRAAYDEEGAATIFYPNPPKPRRHRPVRMRPVPPPTPEPISCPEPTPIHRPGIRIVSSEEFKLF